MEDNHDSTDVTSDPIVPSVGADIPNFAAALNAGLERALKGMNRHERRKALKLHELSVRKALKTMHLKLSAIAKSNANGPTLSDDPNDNGEVIVIPASVDPI